MKMQFPNPKTKLKKETGSPPFPFSSSKRGTSPPPFLTLPSATDTKSETLLWLAYCYFHNGDYKYLPSLLLIS